jgi:hypothetical protein
MEEEKTEKLLSAYVISETSLKNLLRHEKGLDKHRKSEKKVGGTYFENSS